MHLLPILVFVWVLSSAHAEPSITLSGEWITAGSDARIRIFSEGDRWFGKIVWLEDRPEGPAEELVDFNNPDPELRNKPLLGRIIIRNFRPSSRPRRWTGGTIYDPESGRTYRAILQLADENTLLVRGYVGIPLFSRTETWTRP